MPEIHILNSETIDKIAAGEVVERPVSVVKELVENAIDAGASDITVEIKDGGIEFIRVTDNGCGMEKEELKKAFLRHATSKIQDAGDLQRLNSLGFRGEALSSISAVARVEVMTKVKASLLGSRMDIEGGSEGELSEVGVPDGTTFIVRNLFYNTPVRRKFLKTAATEGGYIEEMMEHLALSRPDISFTMLNNGRTSFHTNGSGDLKEVIYRIYGREISESVIPIKCDENGISIKGYLGKPIIVRSNRNYEIYFINGRFVRNDIMAKAVEEGYREYLMQHKFPFCILHIEISPDAVDVNVHPTKLDVRFSDQESFLNTVSGKIRQTLKDNEMLPGNVLSDEKELIRDEKERKDKESRERIPEGFETGRINNRAERIIEKIYKDREAAEESKTVRDIEYTDSAGESFFVEEKYEFSESGDAEKKEPEKSLIIEDAKQLNLVDERIISADNKSKYRIIGQVFETYWMVQYEDKLFMIDQHAAHEKVYFERFMAHFKNKDIVTQSLMPPIVVSLSGAEEAVYKEYADAFSSLGFEVENFGGNEYAIRGIPMDLYGHSPRELFVNVLDELMDYPGKGSFEIIEEKIASMSCKAAVKGNNVLSFKEAESLIDELLTLDNPYNCPHGRPTIIVMSKYEMDKKFKRIV